MNKIIIFNILKELIIKYKNNELDEKTYNQILTNSKFCSITNNLSSYKETELLSLLFKTIPYYKLFTFMQEFITYLKSISNNENTKFITSLIEGVFCEFVPTLSKRIATETNAHIYKLCQIFYINLELDYEIAIRLLTRNSLLPEKLVGLDIASNAQYQQEAIPTFYEKEENLRENISKRNYNQASSIETKLTTLLSKFYTSESLQSFEERLNEIFEEYKKKNPQDADLLYDTIFEQYTLIKMSIKKKWQGKAKKQNEDPMQLNIFSLTKNKA